MVSVQNLRQNNQFQKEMGFGFDETLKQKANPTDWLTRPERKKMIKASKSENYMVMFSSYGQV
jgi:hypothetical protein